MDPHAEKPCGDSYHANGQSDSEAWSETAMEPAEARRSRLSFSDTYVEMLYVAVCRWEDDAADSQMALLGLHAAQRPWVFFPTCM